MYVSLAGKRDTVYYNDNTFENSKYLVSTMPIDSFLKLFKDYNYGLLNLKFRNTILVYVKINKDNLFKDQWLYIQDKDVKTGRITNFNNWIPEKKKKKKGSVLACEYWTYENENLWKMDEKKLMKVCNRDLIKCGFISNEKEIFSLAKRVLS